MKHLTDTNQVLGANYRVDIKDSGNILENLSRIERAAIATSAHEIVSGFFKYNPKRSNILYVISVNVRHIIEIIEYGNGRILPQVIEDVREVNLLDV